MEEKSQKAYSSIAINEIQCYKRKLIGFFIISSDSQPASSRKRLPDLSSWCDLTYLGADPRCSGE